MPKTNSDSDFGGSLTSDESDVDIGPSSPISGNMPVPEGIKVPASTPVTLKTDTRANHSPSNLVSPITVASPTSPTKSNRERCATLNDVSGASTLKGAALFRSTVRKVMAIHRTSSFMGAFRGAGAEPGIDPRRSSAFVTWGHIKEKCSIEVMDYSSVRSKSCTYDNQGFINFLQDNGPAKESWAKVRWICVGGISWDVISALALAYDLHPLSLEDVLHRRGHIRSKADYYPKHLFIRALCHSLGDPDAINDLTAYTGAQAHNITDAPRSSSPGGMSKVKSFEDKEIDLGYETNDEMNGSSYGIFRRARGRSGTKKTVEREMEEGPQTFPNQSRRTNSHSTAEALLMLEQLKAGQRINVLRRNLFMYLLRDGTFITIHQTNTPDFASPIMNRLHSRDTLLRSTADASLLLESVLDLVVDQAVEVVEEYQKMILKLERDILLKPKMKSVRHLHILSGDLTLHKRTLGPLKPLIYGLRRYDLDRCIAVAEAVTEMDEDATGRKIKGYMSHKSKVYLADVHDHVEYVLLSLDMFASVAENLINYTFNMASYEMNEVMRRLTLATIIFLPLTLLTGYFGMNFATQPSVQEHSDVLFWEISIPVMIVVVSLFMWDDVIRMKHYLEKKTKLGLLRKNTATRHLL
ncbi:hypothetical protein BU17DRAFT_81765 [Hysterangium stoloniferum]|nr:hypothetical protein BU17DRAFT_81765 [Hysterangium stoloniferum]